MGLRPHFSGGRDTRAVVIDTITGRQLLYHSRPNSFCITRPCAAFLDMPTCGGAQDVCSARRHRPPCRASCFDQARDAGFVRSKRACGRGVIDVQRSASFVRGRNPKCRRREAFRIARWTSVRTGRVGPEDTPPSMPSARLSRYPSGGRRCGAATTSPDLPYRSDHRSQAARSPPWADREIARARAVKR